MNQTLAEHYWPGQDPVGKRFRLNDRNGPWVEIVGVAKDGKYVTIMEAPTEFVYLPLKQNPQPERILLAQSAGDSAGLMSSLREVVRTLDSNQPIFDARTMSNCMVFAPIGPCR